MKSLLSRCLREKSMVGTFCDVYDQQQEYGLLDGLDEQAAHDRAVQYIAEWLTEVWGVEVPRSDVSVSVGELL